MPNFFKRKRRYQSLSKEYTKGEIDPDEILIDAKNLPEYDIDRLEGRLEHPISKKTLFVLGFFFVGVLLIFSGKAFALQIKNGSAFETKSENNRLKETSIIAERGVVMDRKGELLAWNVPNGDSDFALRKYIEKPGFGILLGYLSYPQKDAAGNYFQNHFVGKDGIEQTFNDKLSGINGLEITETDALGHVESQSTLEPPQNGETLKLSIDARIQEELYNNIQELADRVHFVGGSGVIMDIKTGELLAMTSYPEFESQILTDGKDKAAISGYATNPRNPYLDRPISGLYTPGSIVKPFVALGALTEKIIDPEKQILSTGSISLPNPYDPAHPSIFKDWRAQGYVDMRHAIAVSSDVYFYEVGGGFQDQKGLGINNIEKYLRLFGFGGETGIDIGSEEIGTIPDPAWKADNFNGEQWRVGDTYNTAIGQYGMQITPIQMVRAIAAIANDGILLSPTILEGGTPQTAAKLPIASENFQIVREGMRLGAQIGTAAALNIPDVEVAAKTGTAQLGVSKSTVNSWVTGFFPYKNPRYAFIIQMEKGPAGNIYGASLVMLETLKWMAQNTPEYLSQN